MLNQQQTLLPHEYSLLSSALADHSGRQLLRTADGYDRDLQAGKLDVDVTCISILLFMTNSH